jgi:hypothetical protein
MKKLFYGLFMACLLFGTVSCSGNAEAKVDVSLNGEQNEDENSPNPNLPIGTWIWDAKPEVVGVLGQSGYIQFLSGGHAVYSWNTLEEGLAYMRRDNLNYIVFAVFGLWDEKGGVFHFYPTSYIKAFFGDGEELRRFQNDMINRKDIRTHALRFSIHEIDESIGRPFDTAEIVDEGKNRLLVHGIEYPSSREEALPFIKFYKFNEPKYLNSLAELMKEKFEDEDSSEEFIEEFLELNKGDFR